MGYWKRVQRVISNAELVLEVIDARFPTETRNMKVEELVAEKGKKLVLVLNKSDLVSKKAIRREKKELGKTFPVVFVSGKKRTGINKLREAIGKTMGSSKGRIAVVGYPNTGKSSIINALSGKRLGVSITAGWTKGEQLIGFKPGVQLIDSPGVIPFEERDEVELAFIGAKSPSKVKDMQGLGERIIGLFLEKNPKVIEEEFGVSLQGKDPEQVLEEIAKKKGKLMKGGKADLNAISQVIALAWQKGKLRV